MTFIRTTAINKILQMTARKKIIQGGTSAGKTFGIIPVLIDIAIKEPNKEISIVAETYPHLRRGAMKDFRKIMEDTYRWSSSGWHNGHSRYTFANGSYIEFFSADSEARLRGARRNILYINEANQLTFEEYYQLAIRTNEDIYIDFNPVEEFWAHTEVATEDDAELIVLTYKDNEALDDTIIRDIEKARDKGKTSDYWLNWWNVYGLGKTGRLEGVVFSNWEQIDRVPEDARLLGYGLDFGYSDDPTSVVALYKFDGKLVIDEMLYQKELSNREIARFCVDNCSQGFDVIGDSAEPKSIREISEHHVRIYGAKKGADSIHFGIQLLQGYQMLVTKRSVNLIRELRNYMWDRNKSGKQLPKPMSHVDDHCLDALRYIAMDKLGHREDESYSVY